jgi:hypothetical protein
VGRRFGPWMTILGFAGVLVVGIPYWGLVGEALAR